MLQQDTILSVRNLGVRYNSNVQAVIDLSFDIKKSEVFALTGESGSGKSSIAFAIPRLLTDCEIDGEIFFQSDLFGEVNLLEIESEKLSDMLGNEISVIFQEPYSSFNPVIKCGEQILETILRHEKYSAKSAKDKVLETLKLCGLNNSDKVFNSYPHELSGGQLQRVAIAMAIINEPKLLIADEMTSNLDAITSNEILNLLEEIKAKISLSVLFVSHDLSLFKDFCDKILVLKNGRIVESGPTKKILLTPSKDYTKSLINSSVYEKKASPFKSNEEILSINNLELEYKQGNTFLFNNQKTFKALDKVSFDLKSGEILGLIGRSGSGKTSIGKTIVQLIDNFKGQITFKGNPLSQLSRNELRNIRKSIQIIFQDPMASLDPRLSIGYSLKEPFKSFKLLENDESIESNIDKLLELVGLNSSYKNRLPDELSGGEKQRVCIARALSLKPEVLICDEAVSSLDPKIKRDILNLLDSLREQKGLSILFISHDINLVEYLCDRIITIEAGKIISESLNA